MKFIRQLLALCVVIGAMGAATSVNAAQDAKAEAKDIVLKGDAKCTSCHDEGDSPQILHIAKTRHGVRADGRTPTCTSCHGESEKHLKTAQAGGKNKPTQPDVVFGTKTKNTAEERSNACLSCHSKDAKRMHWEGSQHQSRDVACTSCHQGHAQSDKVLSKATQSEVCFTCHKTERAQTHRISAHPLDTGKMSCSDCHNPHGSDGPKLMVKNSVRDTCFQCHAEKRGPFLFEHPVAMDDCMNCHTPHGSTNQPLLKARAPWLCQECHSDGAPHPGNIYSAANLPGGAVANANRTGGNAAGTGAALGTPLNKINPVTGQAITMNNPSTQLAFRGCVNCHTQIHGSNHPGGGERFLR